MLKDGPYGRMIKVGGRGLKEDDMGERKGLA